MMFPALMNSVAFDQKSEMQVDANFISKYNDSQQDFDYYVQRLLGIEMEYEETPQNGKIWVPFINYKREDWTFICRNGRIVAKSDSIVWKFVPYEDSKWDIKSDTKNEA